MVQDLGSQEHAIDTWTLFYVSADGQRYSGKLTVTNQRLIFDAKFDGSISGMMTARVASGRLLIDKSEIVRLDTEKKLLKKKVILTLSDGGVHTFDYGAMSIDKLVAAIETR